PLRVWARRPEACAAAVAAGAVAVDSPAALARECDVVVTIVGDSTDVTALHAQMLPQARPGAVFIDMTTAAPATARHSAALAASHGAFVLDAPVSGGVAGAKQGTLAIFVGGENAVLARAAPLLDLLGRHVVHCGDAGAGYRMKLVNQTMIAGTLLGLAEGAALARSGGFRAELLTRSLAHGTAGGRLFDAYSTRMLGVTGEIAFTLGLLRKDVRLAREEAVAAGTSTRLLDVALAALDDACAAHGEAQGVQWLAAPAGGRGALGMALLVGDRT
ncbi:MAG: NAD(P)-dependent oxidoreductase, partial [Rubrivivax sp.]